MPPDRHNRRRPRLGPRASEQRTGQVNSNWSRRVRQSPGASLEVIEHHARRHAVECRRRDGYEWLCPCATTVVIVCGCGSPQFVAASPGTWCHHADEITSRDTR